MMEAVHTEVHLCEENTWKKLSISVLEQKKIHKILYGAKTSFYLMILVNLNKSILR